MKMQMPTYTELLNQVHHQEAAKAVPKQWYKYTVSATRGIVIEQFAFAQGTELGTGTVPPGVVPDMSLCRFTPETEISARTFDAKKKKPADITITPGPHLLNAGRIKARIDRGEVMATPIDAPEDAEAADGGAE